MRFTSYILTVLLLALTPTANADEKSKLSPEFEILNRFVGTWDMDMAIKPVGADVVNVKKTETRKWSPGKTVIHFEDSNVSAPNQDSGSVPEFQMLLSYDVVTKTYRGMMMYGTSRTLVSGTWDDATRTMTFNGMSPDDRSTFVFKHRFLDADHAESTGIQRNAQGEVFMEQTIKQTRRTE